jgi:hypothetical protein
MTEPKITAQPSGFVPNNGPPPANLPMKVGFRRRVRPECTLQVDPWLLSPATLRQIIADLRRQARSADPRRQGRCADPAALADAADELTDFMKARLLYGEGVSPW